MFLGLTGERDRDQNITTCWGTLELGFKILFISELVLCLLGYILPGVFMLFPNIVVLTVEKIQLWRLISSFMMNGSSQFAILSVLFDFYILYMFLPDLVILPLLSKKNYPQPISCWKSSCRSSSATSYSLLSATHSTSFT